MESVEKDGVCLGDGGGEVYDRRLKSGFFFAGMEGCVGLTADFEEASAGLVLVRARLPDSGSSFASWSDPFSLMNASGVVTCCCGGLVLCELGKLKQ